MLKLFRCDWHGPLWTADGEAYETCERTAFYVTVSKAEEQNDPDMKDSMIATCKALFLLGNDDLHSGCATFVGLIPEACDTVGPDGPRPI